MSLVRSFRKRARAEKSVFARKLRHEPTPAEALLWEHLRRRQLGWGFRRQHVIFGWIVDFYCPQQALIVEVDGDSHVGREAEDARREQVLRGAGFGFLRFPNALVLEDTADVVRQIRLALLEWTPPERKGARHGKR